MRQIYFFTVLIAFPFFIFGQIKQTEIGQWREHVPYNIGNSVAGAGNIIYCGSSAGFIAYNYESGEVKRYSTITGLSDIGVTLLKYNDQTNSLLVAYKNGNMDILENGRIINMAFILDDNDILGDKTIHNIRMDEELAYISTGFGIVVLDLKRKEIKDTYFIGENSSPLQVNDVYLHKGENKIYAATAKGIRYANLDDNLADYNFWSQIQYLDFPNANYTHIDFFANKFFLNHATDVFDSDMVYTMEDTMVELFLEASFSGTRDFQVEKDRLIISKFYNIIVFDSELKNYGNIYTYDDVKKPIPAMTIHYKELYWIADLELGLVKYSTQGVYDDIAPDGPNSLSVNNMDIQKNVVWTTSGLLDPDYRFSINDPEFNQFQNREWEGFNKLNEKELDSLYGFVSVAVNPFDPKQVFFGSWDNGLIEMNDGKVVQKYNVETKASTGHTLSTVPGFDFIRIGGMVFDENENLWITNSETPFALSVKKKDNTWMSFDLGNFVDAQTVVGDIFVAPNGYKWMILNRSGSANRILIFDDNGTIDFPPDDRAITLTTEDGRGSIPGSYLHTFARDKGGSLWIGTNEGPAVFYSPDNVFESQQEAQRILVQQDGQTQILLENENVKSITVDGADRKWIGTSNSGVFLMSSDGTKEVHHFTKENSPLFSDEINHIEINDFDGDVFICTSEGLISYKGTATEGESTFGDVHVFPNPVKPGYTGPIAINGLAENANVKITDVNGILIFETNAYGGQAIWDGHSIKGNKARNGVYLIWATDTKGESSVVTKLLFLNY